MAAKNYQLNWIGSRTNILCKYVVYADVFNFGREFCDSFSKMLFSKFQASCGKKKFQIIFTALYFYLSELKECVSGFKILFQTGDVNIFILCGIFFTKYVQLKSSLPDEKNSGEIWDTL